MFHRDRILRLEVTGAGEGYAPSWFDFSGDDIDGATKGRELAVNEPRWFCAPKEKRGKG
jgi:hypothetical protein